MSAVRGFMEANLVAGQDVSRDHRFAASRLARVGVSCVTVNDGFISRGFTRRRRTPEDVGDRLPPGQYLESEWPVLTAGPTPDVSTDEWSFRIDGMVAEPKEWSWEEFHKLPIETITKDIHCVTKWSKFDADFGGVSMDVLLEQAEPLDAYAVFYAYGGYTTNLPIEEISDGKAWVVTEYEGEPLAREHGGPVRAVVPKLYFWKSAKWIRRIELIAGDRRGFWEERGYHDRGDPWTEQRYG
jgi:DMSO/TMAO reductase YedYZ molybdopterin-dependent catalytic subunit